MKNNEVDTNVINVNEKDKSTRNTLIMQILVILGVIILCVTIVYLMNYFFVKKSYIKINMSTDKQLEYIKVDGNEELITTQKYVSDLSYTMRYDTNKFTVFKYKGQDIYRFKNNEKILVVVEKSVLPSTCSDATLDMEYNNCYIALDNYTDEYYISKNESTYKVTVKNPNTTDYENGVKTRIEYMIKSFEMNDEK